MDTTLKIPFFKIKSHPECNGYNFIDSINPNNTEVKNNPDDDFKIKMNQANNDVEEDKVDVNIEDVYDDNDHTINLIPIFKNLQNV